MLTNQSAIPASDDEQRQLYQSARARLGTLTFGQRLFASTFESIDAWQTFKAKAAQFPLAFNVICENFAYAPAELAERENADTTLASRILDAQHTLQCCL